MNPPSRDSAWLRAHLKRRIADWFRLELAQPDLIPDDAPLIGGSLGLDSLDALDLAQRVEDEFHCPIPRHEDLQRALASIASLAAYVQAARNPVHALPPASSVVLAAAG